VITSPKLKIVDGKKEIFIMLGNCRCFSIKDGCRARGSIPQQPTGIRSKVSSSKQDGVSLTELMFEKSRKGRIDGGEAQGAGGGTSFDDLKRLDAAWYDLRHKEVHGLRPKVVKRTHRPLPCDPGIDVIVCGGTLGIFLAQALQARGLKTAVVERGALRGRDQEWNISRKELMELVELDVLSESQLEGCISREFNPVEAAFHGSQKIVTKNVLNLGVSPKNLIEQTLKNYKSMGGLVLDSMPVSKVFVHPNGIQVRFGSSSGEPEKAMAGKLLVDCMGNQSPIVRQVRHGRKPDGVCLVVGSCCRGFREEENQSGDVICTVSPSEPPDSGVASGQRSLHNLQLFWEAFPAGSGPTDRTTYMFTYLDASSERPSFLHLMEHYWKAMPAYQQVELDDMDPLRILFGLFPTYKDAPLAPSFDRILAIGDASGMQSPLSFGGFAALLRHLGRLTDSIEDAIQLQCTDKGALKYINAYNPSLSGAWMLQKAMSIPATARKYDVDFINRLLGGNFAVMKEEGEELLRPFLQDVIQAIPLTRTLFGQMKADPLFVPAILARVGPGPLSDWLVHYIGLLAYTVMYRLSNRYGLLDVANNLPDRQKFILRRAVERWQYGSGLDIDAP